MFVTLKKKKKKKGKGNMGVAFARRENSSISRGNHRQPTKSQLFSRFVNTYMKMYPSVRSGHRCDKAEEAGWSLGYSCPGLCAPVQVTAHDGSHSRAMQHLVQHRVDKLGKRFESGSAQSDRMRHNCQHSWAAVFHIEAPGSSFAVGRGSSD